MILITAWTGMGNSDGHCFTLAVVVLPSAFVGDLDLAPTKFGRILGSLPACAQGDNVLSVLNHSSVDYRMRSQWTGWLGRWDFSGAQILYELDRKSLQPRLDCSKSLLRYDFGDILFSCNPRVKKSSNLRHPTPESVPCLVCHRGCKSTSC